MPIYVKKKSATKYIYNEEEEEEYKSKKKGSIYSKWNLYDCDVHVDIYQCIVVSLYIYIYILIHFLQFV